jgi:hypothetical protein
VESRNDLRRLNAIMGHAAIITAALRKLSDKLPRKWVEFGAGDGTCMLKVARRLGPSWSETELLLLDRHPVVTGETLDQFSELHWKVQRVEADVFKWLPDGLSTDTTAVVANLFLHHFSDAALAGLFAAVARRGVGLVALEPRRSPWAHLASCCVGMIGCNAITRHDAPVSVRAGFRDRELSKLWPAQGWELEERSAGRFSHWFAARPTEGLS